MLAFSLAGRKGSHGSSYHVCWKICILSHCPPNINMQMVVGFDESLLYVLNVIIILCSGGSIMVVTWLQTFANGFTIKWHLCIHITRYHVHTSYKNTNTCSVQIRPGFHSPEVTWNAVAKIGQSYIIRSIPTEITTSVCVHAHKGTWRNWMM